MRKLWVCMTEEFLHKLSETISGKLICVLVCANAHLWWPLARWRSVIFTDESRFQLYRADGRQLVWHRVGKWFADVSVVRMYCYCSFSMDVVIIWDNFHWKFSLYQDRRGPARETTAGSTVKE
jgi:hypothetical protein